MSKTTSDRRLLKTVLLLLVILGIAGGVLLPANFPPRRRTKDPVPVATMESRALIAALKAYQADFNSLPKGNEAEIAKALMGNNERQTHYLTFSASRIDPEGRLLDPWGTPYKIRISNATISISSAGKNKKFLDSDDVIATGDALKY